ncbi:MAG: RraA family protein [Rubrivivax sp.]
MATPQGVIAVKREVQRADPAAVQALAGAGTGFVVDANGRRGALDSAIRPVSKAVSFCGPAYTVRTRGRDNLAAYTALAFAQPGDVLVIATDGYREASVVGDVFIGLARNRGVVAVVTDGMVRDVAGIDAVGIPVFALGLSPNSPHKDGPGELGTQVCLGGSTVNTGDIVRGDADGVVVVAREAAAAVVTALDKVRAQEARMDQWVRDGLDAPPWLREFIEGGALRELD